jgi:hypothetical protein
VQVSISWLQDRPEAYQAVCKLCASQEFIAKSIRDQHCRGTSGPGHTYEHDRHLHLSKCMVRKICTEIHSKFIYATNYYPQERESIERPPYIKVWKRGHRGSDPSQPG